MVNKCDKCKKNETIKRKIGPNKICNECTNQFNMNAMQSNNNGMSYFNNQPNQFQGTPFSGYNQGPNFMQQGQGFVNNSNNTQVLSNDLMSKPVTELTVADIFKINSLSIEPIKSQLDAIQKDLGC